MSIYYDFLYVMKKICLTSLLLISVLESVLAQGFNTDYIRYINPDGISFREYTKAESESESSWHFIEKGKRPEEVYSFISPQGYKLVPMLNESYNKILFDQGSFSLIREDTMREELVIKDGIYVYQNDFQKDSSGYYGCSAAPDGFSYFNYVWVFPSNFEVLTHECNRKGTWRLENNTLSFIGENVNNLLFKITYRTTDELPLYLQGRDIVLKDTVEVKGKAITISIWDDSKIDNDVISIKLNDEWIVKYLEAKQEKIKFKCFLTQPENFIILRADNIGQIPPNTTAVNIDDGTNSRTIVLNSDLGMSEAIKINLNTE